MRPGRYPILLVRPDGSTCTESSGSFIKDAVVPAGGTGTLEYLIDCSAAQIQRRLDLDYGAIQNSGGSVAPGMQTIPLLEDGSPVGSIPVMFGGSTFVDPSRGVVGLGQNGSIELDLDGASLPSGAPAPDQLKLEVQGRDNPAPRDLRIQRKQSDGSIIEESTQQIENDAFLIDGAAAVYMQLLTFGFADVLVSIFFGG